MFRNSSPVLIYKPRAGCLKEAPRQLRVKIKTSFWFFVREAYIRARFLI